MLTKDLLKFRRRSDRIVPIFIDPKDDEQLNLAELLIGIFSCSQGLSLADLEEQIADLALAEGGIGPGLSKLLFDRLTMQDDDGTSEEFRWEILMLAENLRRNETQGIFGSSDEFASALQIVADCDAGVLRERLYADLPENRKVLAFDALTAADLLHRWNCAQIQGLLLRATDVEITATGVSLASKRYLFRQLKFHRLLSLVDDIGSDAEDPNADVKATDFKISLSGPMSLFDQVQTYGMKIANFFPHCLNLERWQLKADVKWQDRSLQLIVNEKCAIKSHYKFSGSYIPSELLACIESFNEKHRGAKVAVGDEFVHIGRQSYCFPDLSVVYVDTGRKINIELFHRWHVSQLKNRLQALDLNPLPDLRIGVCKSLLKTQEYASILDGSTWYKKFGFTFRDFPTPQNIWTAVQQQG